MAPSETDQDDAYVARSSETVRDLINKRSLDKELSYLAPTIAKLRPDFVFCDAGCGPASISIDVAKRYPAATVLAIDLDSGEIEAAKKNALDAGVSNIRFAVGSVLEIEALADKPGFEDLRGNCDIVHEHMVMMHTADPLLMMKQMRKAAKVGGLVACRDLDPGMLTAWPPNPAIEKYTKHMPTWIGARGADPQLAKKLLHYALAAGFRRENIDFSLGNWVYSSPAEKEGWLAFNSNMWREKAVVEKMTANLPVDPEEMIQGWIEWSRHDDAWYAMITPQVICTKEP